MNRVAVEEEEAEDPVKPKKMASRWTAHQWGGGGRDYFSTYRTEEQGNLCTSAAGNEVENVGHLPFP